MSKFQLILFCISIEISLIAFVALANSNPTTFFYFLFYNILYGAVCSVLVPLYFWRKEKAEPSAIGIKKMGKRQFIVLAAFVAFSTAGQLVPKIIAKDTIQWRLLPSGIVPLLMTTFFEEFLFRAFIQTRIEKNFGAFTAIIVSGAMFSLYHLGYPGFRNSSDIILLFAVGIGFALAYKISDNNLIVAYFVNLPNAFITYILKYEQFPKMNLSATVFAAVTLVIVFSLFSASIKIKKT